MWRGSALVVGKDQWQNDDFAESLAVFIIR